MRSRRALLLLPLLLLTAAGPGGPARAQTSDFNLISTFISLVLYPDVADVRVSLGIDADDPAVEEDLLDEETFRSDVEDELEPLGVDPSDIEIEDIEPEPFPSRAVNIYGLDAEQIEGFLGGDNELFRFFAVSNIEGFWNITATLTPLQEAGEGVGESQVFADILVDAVSAGGEVTRHDGEEVGDGLVQWTWAFDEPVDMTIDAEVFAAEDAVETEAPEDEPSPSPTASPRPAAEATPAPGTGAGASPGAGGAVVAPPAPTSSGLGAGAWIAIIAGAVVVVLAAILIPLLISRRNRSRRGGPPPGGWPPQQPGQGWPAQQQPPQQDWPPQQQQPGWPPQQQQQPGWPPQQQPPPQHGWPPQRG